MTQRHLYPTIVNFNSFNKKAGNILIPNYPYTDRQFFVVGCGGKCDESLAAETSAVIFQDNGNIASRGHGRFLNAFEENGIRNYSDLSADNQQILPVYNNTWKSFRLFNLSLSVVDIDAEIHISKDSWKYFPFMRFCEERMETPIFYKKKKDGWFDIELYDIRNKITGEYVSFDDLEELSEEFKIPMASNFNDEASNIKERKNIIVRYDNGLRYVNK